MTDQEKKDLEQAAMALGYEALKAFKKNLDELSLDELRTLLAYEEWKDGMEDNDVMDVWLGTAFIYDTREPIMDRLVNVYGY